MKELTIAQYPFAAPLFDDTPHNRPVIFSVFDGMQTGRVFANSDTQPTWAILVLEDMLFLAGAPDDTLTPESLHTLLHDVIAQGSPIPYYELHPLHNAWYPLLNAAFTNEILVRRVRQTFSITQEQCAEHAKALARPLPEGYEICPLDAAIAGQMMPMPPAFWASETGRFGTAILHGEKPVSVCFSVFTGGGMAEISIETDEAYRRQGLALQCTIAFLDTCKARGLAPNWACWQEREASAAMAQKLGFSLSNTHEALVVDVRGQGEHS